MLLSGTHIPYPEQAGAIDLLARRNGPSPEEVLRRIGGSVEVQGYEPVDDRPDFEQMEMLRRHRRPLVGHLHHLTGREHQEINAQVSR